MSLMFSVGVGVRGVGEVKVVAGYSLAYNGPPYMVAGYVPGVQVWDKFGYFLL